METKTPRSPLHLITVHETIETEIEASSADIDVLVKGNSFWTGNEAFKKADEIQTLVRALTEVGLEISAIQLREVSVELESGLLSKSSSARYKLRVHCPSTDLLGRVLSTISSQKNAKVDGVIWRYANLETIKRNLLQATVRKAKETAQSVAESLGVPLLGVHKCAHEISGANAFVKNPRNVVASRAKLARPQKITLDQLNLSHSDKIHVTAKLEFIVGTFYPENA